MLQCSESPVCLFFCLVFILIYPFCFFELKAIVYYAGVEHCLKYLQPLPYFCPHSTLNFVWLQLKSKTVPKWLDFAYHLIRNHPREGYVFYLTLSPLLCWCAFALNVHIHASWLAWHPPQVARSRRLESTHTESSFSRQLALLQRGEALVCQCPLLFIRPVISGSS